MSVTKDVFKFVVDLINLLEMHEGTVVIQTEDFCDEKLSKAFRVCKPNFKSV